MGVLGVIRADLGYWKGMRSLGFYFEGGFRGIMGVLGGGLKVFWGEGVELSLGFWGGGIMGRLEAFGEFWNFLGGQKWTFLGHFEVKFLGCFSGGKTVALGKGIWGKKEHFGVIWGSEFWGEKQRLWGEIFGVKWTLLGPFGVRSGDSWGRVFWVKKGRFGVNFPSLFRSSPPAAPPGNPPLPPPDPPGPPRAPPGPKRPLPKIWGVATGSIWL